MAGTLPRPQLPPGFDASRAAERRADPAGWRYTQAEIDAVLRVIEERRDIRRFRPDPVPPDVLRRVLDAAHRAPSVGLMQPWRFLIVQSEATRSAMQAVAARERLVQAAHFDERTRQYLDLKIEGIREAPIGICVCCDRGDEADEVLGRHTIRDTDLYSTCLAIQNLWLAARAEGLGVGWVSFYRPDDVRPLLGLPQRVLPVAWLCVGYPDERPVRPGLEAAGWGRRLPLEDVVHSERWAAPALTTSTAPASPTPPDTGEEVPDWLLELLARVPPVDAGAAIALRDRSDQLVKPAGSLGVLESIAERWAAVCGGPPPRDASLALLVFAADHGVASRSVSLYPARVGGQVAEAAARGETAVGVLSRQLGGTLRVIDVGLRGPRRAGVVDRRVADGTGDISSGPALTPEQVRAGLLAGHAAASDLARDHDILAVGEIGIGNTTVASALLAALTGLPPAAVCGRGTGLDAQGVARKREVVAAALAANAGHGSAPLACLQHLGGHEFTALVGAVIGAAAARRIVVLDGFATGVAALVACRLHPPVRDHLVAGHLSAEPAHAIVLRELGLEPLLDLRLRLGEASGAALALPLLRMSAVLQADMGTFAESKVDRA